MRAVLLAAALCAASPAYAQSALEFAASGMGKSISVAPKNVGRPLDIRTPVQRMIAEHVSARIGPQWVGTALRIAKIESGYRCTARNRMAVGVFQNTNPQIFGVSRAAQRSPLALRTGARRA